MQQLGAKVELLAQLSGLRGLPAHVLERLAPLCALRAFLPGTPVVPNLPDAFLYVFLQGRLTMTLHDRLGHRVPVGQVQRGEIFGEGPLFSNMFHHVTGQAETTCYVLQLSLDAVRGAMKQSPELTAVLRATYVRRLVESSLSRVPLFSKLPPGERMYLTELLQSRHYERGDLIIHEGAHGDSLYIVEAGQVAIEQSGHVIAHLDEGNFFGEMSLLTSEPHTANVYALTPVDVLALPASGFLKLLDKLPALNEELQRVVARRRQNNTTMLKDAERAQQLAAIVDHGLLRGTHLLVRDPELCDPDCHLCEDACAERYGRARLQLPGVNIDGQDVADACRQCRFGAECVEACPEDAIQWNNSGVLVVTDRCTGCGDCVPACPYDAMALMPLKPAHSTSPLWALWDRMKHMRTPVIMLETAEPAMRADKCDFCQAYNDMACVSACPNGALRFVPLQEVFPL
jgi:CRP-like cAMP-binding protein/Fe-S-cluster-containing hydrogenase component 2